MGQIGVFLENLSYQNPYFRLKLSALAMFGVILSGENVFSGNEQGDLMITSYDIDLPRWLIFGPIGDKLVR